MRDHYYSYLGEKGALGLSITQFRNDKSRDIILGDISVHSPKPLHDGDEAGMCALLPGGECYCSGRYIDYETAHELVEGNKDIAEFLMEEYRKHFGG